MGTPQILKNRTQGAPDDQNFLEMGGRDAMSSQLELSENALRELNGPVGQGAAPKHQPLVVIKPPSGWHLINFAELWQYRGLIFYFMWRDVKVRYKHTILGIGWAVIQPLLMMVVFASFFTIIRGPHNTGAVPYPVYVYSGIMVWLFFSQATIAAGNSIVHSEHLVTKVYFPRMVSTVASIGVYVVDFVIAFLLFLLLLVLFRDELRVSPTIVLAPLVLALFALAALAVGTLMAVLNVTYRDFRLVVPFMMQLWFFATPVIFMPTPQEPAADVTQIEETGEPDEGAPATTSSVVDQHEVKAWDRHTALLILNPVYSLVVTFRAVVFGGAIPWPYLGLSVSFFVALLLLGSLYFHRAEDRFADII